LINSVILPYACLSLLTIYHELRARGLTVEWEEHQESFHRYFCLAHPEQLNWSQETPHDHMMFSLGEALFSRFGEACGESVLMPLFRESRRPKEEFFQIRMARGVLMLAIEFLFSSGEEATHERAQELLVGFLNWSPFVADEEVTSVSLVKSFSSYCRSELGEDGEAFSNFIEEVVSDG
jgi:hypothetical protein